MKNQNLTHQQLENHGHAVDLANKANEAFDERHAAALEIAQISVSEEQNIIETTNAKGRFNEADSDFELYNHAAELLMPARVAFETLQPEALEPEPFASKEVWEAMHPQQKLKAEAFRVAIAEQFEDYGVNPDSLRVVMSESPDGKKVFTLLHTGIGIDIGADSKDDDKTRSYKSVMSKKYDKLFKFNTRGHTYDVRKGMTLAAYDALVEDARDRGETVPDSKQQIREANNEGSSTWTMLTGEDTLADGSVQAISSREDDLHHRYHEVRRTSFAPGDGSRNLRIRPAVEIV